MIGRPPTKRALAALVALAACGGGPELTKLRCREPCQDPEAPLRLHLSVDFKDATGTLDKGFLELRVNENTQQSVALKDIFDLQGLAAGTKTGTLDVDQDLVLDRIGGGQTVKASLKATNGNGDESNEPSLEFTLTVGK